MQAECPQFASACEKCRVKSGGVSPHSKSVWNDARFTRDLAHANWMANTAVLMHLNERATGDPARDWLSSWAHRWFVGDALRVLVLGCGEGWLERAVATWPFVAHIDAVDSAAEAVARARDAARGMAKIEYGVVDLNDAELPPDAYDVVVAHSVLHHIENLEHAYAQLERTMRPNATLILNEYVGPKRFQFGDDVLSIMNTLLACLGYPPRTRPGVEEMIATDPTEAVRSDELLGFTERQFEVLERKNIGGTILQHLLYGIVQNFRFENARERSLLEMLCTIDGMLVDWGRVPSDFVILAARKHGSRVTRTRRPLPPRPAAAGDVERDPLWSLPPWRAGARPAVPPAALRLMRLALLSRKPHRANLFRESRLAGWWQTRGASDSWTWLLHRAPEDDAVRCLLQVAATLARA